MRQGLGTQLRHLLDLLDNAVQESYTLAGLSYRPRYTPIVRVLLQRGSCSVGEIAQAAGITQPAATQTIALMVDDGLLEMHPTERDRRVRLVRLTARGHELIPSVQACWRATELAAQSLDSELPMPLSEILSQAIERLEARPFGVCIAQAREGDPHYQESDANP